MMRPGQLLANEFEIALLDCIARAHPDVQLLIPHLHVLSRTFTGVGSFTEFLIKGWPKTGKRRVLGASSVVTIPGLQHGLLFLAFLEGDQLTLETASMGENWDGLFDGFAIGPPTQPAATPSPETG